ncbi:hypothetical protein [Zooshikella harenae]|uniref:Uncharacterized protein n=1 Tax=Zooshikella harenae TaxID=2827238 RepID=A0ABS5ZL95_9GAMM|nr:hypothetical protein [Zooshikella harenae]MBU2714150.1 hypothetical protein [Zooshikella harenae]
MSHPYEQYKNTELWQAIESAIKDLIDNKDIELTTNVEYVVGYVCKKVSTIKTSDSG